MIVHLEPIPTFQHSQHESALVAYLTDSQHLGAYGARHLMPSSLNLGPAFAAVSLAAIRSCHHGSESNWLNAGWRSSEALSSRETMAALSLDCFLVSSLLLSHFHKLKGGLYTQSTLIPLLPMFHEYCAVSFPIARHPSLSLV